MTRGLLLNTLLGLRKSVVKGATWFKVVRPVVPTGSTVFTEPGTYCGWLKALKKSARTCKYFPSVKWKFLKTEMSKLLIAGKRNVLRPIFETAPFPVWMYFAFGFTAV